MGDRHRRQPTATRHAHLDQSLDGATQANVIVNFGDGQLTLGALPSSDTTQLASLTFQGPANVEPTARYQVQNGVGQLQYGVNGRPGLAGSALPMLSGRQSRRRRWTSP